MRIPKRLPIFVLASVLTFGLGVWFTRITTTVTYCPRFSPWETLLKFENQDLQGLDEESGRQVQAAVEAVTGKRNEHTYGAFKPVLFRTMSNTQGEKRYLLVELAQLWVIPGNSNLRVHVFDAAGQRFNVQEFNAGYRMNVGDMRIRKNDVTKHQLLIVTSEYCFGGRPTHQYYALAGNGLMLVYLEQDGRMEHNNYQNMGMAVGPEIWHSFAEWEKALNSSDEAEILSALVWLDDDRRKSDGVRKRLEELSQSENDWIRIAAQTGLEHNK